MKSSHKTHASLTLLALLGTLALSGCFEDKAKQPTVVEPVPVTVAPAPVVESAPAPKPVTKPKPVAHPKPVATPEPKVICDNCGTVTSIIIVEVAGQGTGAGVIIGGVAGGLLGNQVGQGTGKEVATLAGAVGGAIVGHKVEQNMKKTKVYDVTVKLENGEARVVRHTNNPGVLAGDKIKIENDLVVKQ